MTKANRFRRRMPGGRTTSRPQGQTVYSGVAAWKAPPPRTVERAEERQEETPPRERALPVTRSRSTVAPPTTTHATPTASPAQTSTVATDAKPDANASSLKGDDPKKGTPEKTRDVRATDTTQTYIQLLLPTSAHSVDGGYRAGIINNIPWGVRIMSWIWWMERVPVWEMTWRFLALYLFQAACATGIGVLIFHDTMGTGTDYMGVWMAPIMFVWLTHRSSVKDSRAHMARAIQKLLVTFVNKPTAKTSKRERAMDLVRKDERQLQRSGGQRAQEARESLIDYIEERATPYQINIAAHSKVITTIIHILSNLNPYNMDCMYPTLPDVVKRARLLVDDDSGQLDKNQIEVLAEVTEALQAVSPRSSTGFIYLAVFLLTGWIGPILTINSHGIHAVLLMLVFSFVLIIIFLPVTRMNKADDLMTRNVVTKFIVIAYSSALGEEAVVNDIEIDDITADLTRIVEEEERLEKEKEKEEKLLAKASNEKTQHKTADTEESSSTDSEQDEHAPLLRLSNVITDE